MGNDPSKASKQANQPSGGVSGTSDQKSFAAVDVELRRKLGQGVTYNMKVIIRGDRNTGKTNLFRRLQQQDFTEDYVPTKEIQVCTINWNYKVSDDIVKLELWDVVDSSRRRLTAASVASSLRQTDEPDEIAVDSVPTVSAPGKYTIHSLDASTVDVYKGCHAVLMVVDPTKRWTFDYAQEHIPTVPKDIEIALIANCRDLYTRWNVTVDEMKSFVSLAGEHVHFFETCMVDGFGITPITSFLNIPFLNIQRSVLLKKLEKNSESLEIAKKEAAVVSKEQNYAFYLKWLEQQQIIQQQSKSRRPSNAAPLKPSQTPRASIDATMMRTSLSEPSPSVKTSIPIKKDESTIESNRLSKEYNPESHTHLTSSRNPDTLQENEKKRESSPDPDLLKKATPVSTAPVASSQSNPKASQPAQVATNSQELPVQIRKETSFNTPFAVEGNSVVQEQIKAQEETKKQANETSKVEAPKTSAATTATTTEEAKGSGFKSLFGFGKSSKQEKKTEEPKLVIKKEGLSLDAFDTGNIDEDFFSSDESVEEEDGNDDEETDDEKVADAVDVDLDDEDLKQIAPRRISSIGSRHGLTALTISQETQPTIESPESKSPKESESNSKSAVSPYTDSASKGTHQETNIASADDFQPEGELQFSDDEPENEQQKQQQEQAHDDARETQSPSNGKATYKGREAEDQDESVIEIVSRYEDVEVEENIIKHTNGNIDNHVSSKDENIAFLGRKQESSTTQVASIDDFQPEGELRFSDEEEDGSENDVMNENTATAEGAGEVVVEALHQMPAQESPKMSGTKMNTANPNELEASSPDVSGADGQHQSSEDEEGEKNTHELSDSARPHLFSPEETNREKKVIPSLLSEVGQNAEHNKGTEKPIEQKKEKPKVSDEEEVKEKKKKKSKESKEAKAGDEEGAEKEKKKKKKEKETKEGKAEDGEEKKKKKKEKESKPSMSEYEDFTELADEETTEPRKSKVEKAHKNGSEDKEKKEKKKKSKESATEAQALFTTAKTDSSEIAIIAAKEKKKKPKQESEYDNLSEETEKKKETKKKDKDAADEVSTKKSKSKKKVGEKSQDQTRGDANPEDDDELSSFYADVK